MSADLDRASVTSCASSSTSLGSATGAPAVGGPPGPSASSSSGAGIRLLSSNVRKLHGALNLLLSEAEREQFIHCLNVYHCRRNVFDLVQTLKVLLDGPEKRQLLPMLRLVIPRSDQLLFDQYTSEGLYLKADFLPTTANGGLDGALRGEVRQVTLKRNKAQEGLGFSIRGGSEHGVGIYVSLVEPGSLAEKEGLRVGDQILKVNDKPLDKVTHAEAVKALKGSKKLNLSVHSVGRIPGGYVTNHIYTWVDPHGRSVSPPTGLPQHQSSTLRKDGNKRSHLQLLQEGDEKKVNLVLDEGRSLGLMIRGGAEYALGIYITGIDKGSEAESTGLKVGDQILEVNGRSFLSIPHDEAVKILKSSRHLIMTVKDVGRLPHARTTVDETKWIASSQIGETMVNPARAVGDHITEVNTKPSFYRGLAGSQVTLSSLVNQSRVMLEEHARHLLNEPERATMGYYLDEYKESNISVDALVMALFELLNTHAKFSLLSEVRGVISPQDLDRFDNLVLKREIEFMKARQPSGTGTGTDSYSIMSYSDTVSSTGSHFTSTTVSSARNTTDLEVGGNGCQSSINALPDISLDDVSSFPEEPPPFKPPPPSPSSQTVDSSSSQSRNTATDTLTRPSSGSSQSGLFFVAPRVPTASPSLSGRDTGSIASTATSSTEDSAPSSIYASVSRRPMDAHLSLVNQQPIGPFPRVQSPTRLKTPSPEATPASGLRNPKAPSPSLSPPPPPSHPAPPPPPNEKGSPESSTTQHFIMVEVHRPNSEPDVNEVRSLPQARGTQGCTSGGGWAREGAGFSRPPARRRPGKAEKSDGGREEESDGGWAREGKKRTRKLVEVVPRPRKAGRRRAREAERGGGGEEESDDDGCGGAAGGPLWPSRCSFPPPLLCHRRLSRPGNHLNQLPDETPVVRATVAELRHRADEERLQLWPAAGPLGHFLVRFLRAQDFHLEQAWVEGKGRTQTQSSRRSLARAAARPSFLLL
ncbi:PREDICTED: whirlin-like [Gekko japonicus]|uniref:Whirlin-like n=1 Tax=Gekko japonicus TaxID=146911 RepID=A0ABM1L5J0_GEKJA|nr:PREDICTED: whirlin-like [Gekko japonicus]